MNKSSILKKLLNSGKTLIMPDAYDAISAKLIEKAGFKAVQCSGYSFSIAAGYKSEIDVTLDENIEWTRRIVKSVNVPVMADAEDGYGGPEEVIETVDRFIRAGVAGLNIEDQIMDGRKPLSIIDEDLMLQKIIITRETAEAEGNHDFIINGRTDALRSTENRDEGLEIAIHRANQYLEAGADLTFVTYVETLEEVKKITEEVKGPVSIAAGMPYNIQNFSINNLRECGVTRISLPTLLIFSSLQGIRSSLEHLDGDKLLEFSNRDSLYPNNELMKLLKL
ncbi:isocitrate lyase/PEP mutase family protein [Methanobacterium sp. ACI-7]|uniref:isocitrate lyase/PEP mutase family protein n=1 Tax=unclassified Methanobacterium TaxID=2627676 RepID=UPI0039C4CBF3